MPELRFDAGDRVRHAKRPEWGIGVVLRAEDVTVNGLRGQRLSVRFPNAGLKTLDAAHAELERVSTAANEVSGGEGQSVADWERVSRAGWLSQLAERKIEEVMTTVPLEARDPFNRLRDRLAFTLALYRFERAGGKLIDWAVAQSGLDDPLTRFTRQELELMFDRWASERDTHLLRLLQEAQHEPEMVRELIDRAPEAAQKTVQRLRAVR